MKGILTHGNDPARCEEEIRRFPGSDEVWCAAQFAGYIAAYAVFQLGVNYDDKFADVVLLHKSACKIIEAVSWIDTKALTIAQLILLNRLYQFLRLSQENRILWEPVNVLASWNTQVGEPVVRHLNRIFHKTPVKNNYDMHLRVCDIFKDLFVVNHAQDRSEKICCIEKDIEAFVEFLAIVLSRPMQQRQLNFLQYLKNMLTGFPALAAADCTWSKVTIYSFVTNYENEHVTNIAYVLALTFPSFAYSYGFDVHHKNAFAYLLVNFPLTVRYAIISCFDAKECVFRPSDTLKLFPNANGQQMLEYCLLSPLGHAFEECLEVTDYIRRRGEVLSMFLLDDTSDSAAHAFHENRAVIDKCRAYNAAFYKTFTWKGMERGIEVPSASKTYPDRFVDSSAPALSWKHDEFLLSELKTALQVVRATIMHAYWGSLQLVEDDLAYFDTMWCNFFKATSSLSLRRCSDVTIEKNDFNANLSVSYEETQTTWVENGDLKKRSTVYVSSSLIDAFVKNLHLPEKDNTPGYRRTVRSVQKRYFRSTESY